MDFTPGERAVLKQLGNLYASDPQQDYELRVLTALWPPLHYSAYYSAFTALLGKRVVQHSKDRQGFRITDVGVKVISAGG